MHLGGSTNEGGSGNGLVISGVSHSTSFVLVPRFDDHAPTETGQFRVENSSVAIVTFYSFNSTENGTRGFILEYNSIFAGNITGNTESTHHISVPTTLEFQYPPEGNYSSNEFAAFVFPPKDNIYTPNNTGHVSFRIYSMEYNCYESIHLYLFDVNVHVGGNMWTYMGKICKDTESLLFHHDDVAMALFQSDHAIEGRGFGYSVFGC